MHSPAYCTQDDLLALRICTEVELIQLTDAGGLGVIDAEAVAAAAETAAIEIDPYLAPRATVPLASVPDPIKRLACVLTRYYLYTGGPTDHVADQYKAAIRTLERMASGEIGIGAAGLTPDASGAEWTSSPGAWGRGEGGGL